MHPCDEDIEGNFANGVIMATATVDSIRRFI